MSTLFKKEGVATKRDRVADNGSNDTVTVRTYFGRDKVVQVKTEASGATLSMAYARYVFTENVLKAVNGEEVILKCVSVESELTTSPFFASP